MYKQVDPIPALLKLPGSIVTGQSGIQLQSAIFCLVSVGDKYVLKLVPQVCEAGLHYVQGRLLHACCKGSSVEVAGFSQSKFDRGEGRIGWKCRRRFRWFLSLKKYNLRNVSGYLLVIFKYNSSNEIS